MTIARPSSLPGAARAAIEIVALAVLYFLTGKLGLLFAVVHASATAIWPPTGIALAGLLLMGPRVWPAIFAGAFAVNVTTAGSVVTCLGIATGNTLEAVVGAFLITRLARGRHALERGQDALRFALIVLLSSSVSASIGVGTLLLSGYARAVDAGPIWTTWWLGDVAGALIVAPILLLWDTRRDRWSARDAREFALLVISLLLTSGLVFTWPPLNRQPLVFLCVPPLIWVAFRFGPREAATAVASVAFVATGATLQGLGPLATRPPQESLLVVQAFVVTLALMVQPVAAVVAERRRLDEEHRRSEERFRLAVEAAPNAMLMVDSRGIVTLANTQSEILFGYTRAELLGRPAQELIPAMGTSREPSARRKDGGVVPVEVALNPLTVNDEAMVLAAVVDITERKRADEALRSERELLQAIMDRIPVMITIYEPDTRVMRVNREFERVLGWTTEEASNMDLMAACYPDPAYREEMRRYMETLAPGWLDVAVTTKDHRVIETSWANVRLWNDVRVGIGLDVRERARAERERDALMAREQAARADAEATSRSKDEFLAMLAHELRNPLGAIAAAVHVLRVVTPADDRGQQARAVIERQTAHLTRLVDDLLDVARVTSGRVVLAPRPLDLGTLVRDLTGTFRASGRMDQHDVVVDAAEAWIVADPVRIEQVVGNLLDNAIKYTPAGGGIRVAVRNEPGGATLRVADTGAGISPQLLDRVFDLFVQGERTLDRGRGGLGLGLTLVKRLVELHGGTVSAASEGPGRGATFSVTLPAGRPVDTTPPSPRPPATRPLRILVVEDHADAREMLGAALGLAGHEVHLASDGPSGVSAAVALRPDAALVDIGLPGFDGYEVARRIRAECPGKSIHLIALTGYGQPEDRRRTVEAGFDDHLVKPVDPVRLAEMLSECAGA